MWPRRFDGPRFPKAEPSPSNIRWKSNISNTFWYCIKLVYTMGPEQHGGRYAVKILNAFSQRNKCGIWLKFHWNVHRTAPHHYVNQQWPMSITLYSVTRLEVIFIWRSKKMILLNFENSLNILYPEPVYTGWSSVHWNATGMPLDDPVYTGISLGHPANTCRVHWNTTGKT